MNAFRSWNMMSGYDWNNGTAYGPGGMMGGYGYNNTIVTPLAIDQAKAAAEKYIANLNNSDLQIEEIMIFDNNGYVIVKEAAQASAPSNCSLTPFRRSPTLNMVPT